MAGEGGLVVSLECLGLAACASANPCRRCRSGAPREFDIAPEVNQAEALAAIVTPVLYDEPQSWEQVAKVCEVVWRHGGRASARAGAHVHVGVGDYDHTVEHHNNWLRLFRNVEDVLYRWTRTPSTGRVGDHVVSAKPSAGGSLPDPPTRSAPATAATWWG